MRILFSSHSGICRYPAEDSLRRVIFFMMPAAPAKLQGERHEPDSPQTEGAWNLPRGRDIGRNGKNGRRQKAPEGAEGVWNLPIGLDMGHNGKAEGSEALESDIFCSAGRWQDGGRTVIGVDG